MKRTYSSQCKKSRHWLLVKNLLPKIFFRRDAEVSLFSVSLSSWQSVLECSCVHNRTPVFLRLDAMTSSTRRKDRCSMISDPTQWLWTLRLRLSSWRLFPVRRREELATGAHPVTSTNICLAAASISGSEKNNQHYLSLLTSFTYLLLTS